MHISLRNLFVILSLFVLIIISMNFFPESLSKLIANRFSLNAEANIPTWFSTILLFSVSLSCLFIYFLMRNGIEPDHSWRVFWLGLAGVYCFLSMDEAARFHEMVTGALSVKWVYIYAPFALIFLLVCSFYFFVIRKSCVSLRNWVMGGMVMFIFGGLVLEFFSHRFSPLPSVLQKIEFVLEEGFEMMGTIMVLRGCLGELQRLLNISNCHKDSIT